ncbi:lectin-like domain-containing protein [Lactococcus laudensis]|uniref:lectin-like domain-containing protein n=1 Tax=Pseudolactococcus laudensis TaxID=1494461 RepID=UPI002FC6AC04
MAQKQKKKRLRDHKVLVQAGAFLAIVAGALRVGFVGVNDQVEETLDPEKAVAETKETTCLIKDFNDANAAELGHLGDTATRIDTARNDRTDDAAVYADEVAPKGLTNVKQVSSADHNETNLTYEQANQVASANGAVVTPDKNDSVIGTAENKSPDEVKNTVSGFSDVITDSNGNISSGTYTSSDHSRTAIVGNVTDTIGTGVHKSTENGDTLPTYDGTSGKVTDSKTIISNVVTASKDGARTAHATVNGDVAPSTVYDDENGRPVQLEAAQVGQTYYTDAQQTSKIILTQNKQGKVVDETKGFAIPKQISDTVTGQNIINSASLDQANNVIQLTPDKNDQAGTAILGSDKGIDLSQDFDLDASVNLGSHSVEKSCDGISFGFNPIGNDDVGHWGNSFGLGYLNHSFGFKLDTYYNNIKDVMADNASQYNNKKLSEAHGSLPYGPDPLQTKSDGTPQENMNGHSFGAFIYTDANGMVNTYGDNYDGNGGEPYFIDNPSQGQNKGIGQMDIATLNCSEDKENQLAAVISGNNGRTTPWQNIKIHYEAANQTMTITYQGHTWIQNISEWLRDAGTNMKFMISGSTGYASNLQQVKINSLTYTSSPEQAWEEIVKSSVTT